MLYDKILLVFIHLNRIRILHGFLILRYHRVYVPYHMAYSDVFIQLLYSLWISSLLPIKVVGWIVTRLLESWGGPYSHRARGFEDRCDQCANHPHYGFPKSFQAQTVFPNAQPTLLSCKVSIVRCFHLPYYLHYF